MLNEQAALCPAENVKRCSHLLAHVTEEKQMEHVYVANVQVKDKKDDSKAGHRRPAGRSLFYLPVGIARDSTIRYHHNITVTSRHYGRIVKCLLLSYAPQFSCQVTPLLC